MTHVVGHRTAGELLQETPGLTRLEARALLAHALGVPREALIAHPELTVESDAAARYRAAVARRQAGEPLAYLLGEREFYGRSFSVTRDVLVPRPETELLIDLALPRLRQQARPRVLDLGTGSGCIAVTLALEHPAADVTATDFSIPALAIAAANAHRLGAPAIRFRFGSWYHAVAADARFDLIVSNPPYVAAGDPHLHALAFEPALALTDGADGLRCLSEIVIHAERHVAAGGWLIVEHGHDQAAAVGELLRRNGWRPQTFADGAGHPRATRAERA